MSLDEELNFVWPGKGNGDKEIGDNKEEDSGSGDQKQNAYNTKHAPAGEEGKGDNEEDKSGNADQKRKAYKRKCGQKTNDVNQRKMETANNTTTCAQFTYYREFHPSRRSDRYVLPEQTQTHQRKCHLLF